MHDNFDDYWNSMTDSEQEEVIESNDINWSILLSDTSSNHGHHNDSDYILFTNDYKEAALTCSVK